MRGTNSFQVRMMNQNGNRGGTQYATMEEALRVVAKLQKVVDEVGLDIVFYPCPVYRPKHRTPSNVHLFKKMEGE